MLGFIKKMFVATMSFLSYNTLNVMPLNTIPLKCVARNNQECRIRPEIININSNEPIFYPYSITVNKCSGSCDNKWSNVCSWCC